MDEKPKILVVEDDTNIAKALKVRLKANGYDVSVAVDGASGIAALRREPPDLVLLDISMPAGGGLFVAKNMRMRPAMVHTPIVFITASRAEGIRSEAMSYDPAAFLEKPFRSEELLEAIALALSEAAPAGDLPWPA